MKLNACSCVNIRRMILLPFMISYAFAITRDEWEKLK